jgi:catechol 2,3-dioxygenase-like lactoylglutathione lyase family enzyme
MLRFGMAVLGAADMDRAERFWSAALGYTLREKEADGRWRVLAPAQPGEGAELALQFSGEPPRDHPRVHVDLQVDTAAEQSAEADRLVRLGAQRVAWDQYPADPDFVVLADTEGNRFCIVDVSHEPA